MFLSQSEWFGRNIRSEFWNFLYQISSLEQLQNLSGNLINFVLTIDATEHVRPGPTSWDTQGKLIKMGHITGKNINGKW